MVMPGEQWRLKAACRETDPNLYVPTKKGSTNTIRYNKKACKACPVVAECLDFALANRIKFGLWGNTTPKEREKMYRHYEGEKRYDLDLDRLLFPPGTRPRGIFVEDEDSEAVDDLVCDTVAVDDSIYFSRVEESYVQVPLFSGW